MKILKGLKAKALEVAASVVKKLHHNHLISTRSYEFIRTLVRKYLFEKGREMIRGPLGIKMELPPGALYLNYRTEFEENTTKVFVEKIEQGMNVVDIGAFAGHYTLIASELVGEKGRVFSFEPHPKSFSFLKKNIATNGCQNVVLEDKAVYSSRESVSLVVRDDFLTHSTLQEADGVVKEDAKKVKVQTITLDEYISCKSINQVDVIKLDVEGGELAALRGMGRTIHSSNNVVMFMEVNPKSYDYKNYQWIDIYSLLNEYGFTHGLVLDTENKSFRLSRSIPPGSGHRNILVTK
jgi:FkbM family methyltransferase